jgi:hypothetical protein
MGTARTGFIWELRVIQYLYWICTQTGHHHKAAGIDQEHAMIRKLKSGEYRLYSRKIDPKTGRRRNLGTFGTREAAEKHEREVQFFKRQH